MPTKRRLRQLEDLNLIDDFLFHEAISDPESGEEFCRILLSNILGHPIHHVKITAQKTILGCDTDRHGIIMDTYIETIEEKTEASAEVTDVYDIEPDNTYEKDVLPHRVRYYHALIDSKLLEAGYDYSQLKNSVLIMILPYDPFSSKRMVYTIKNHCIQAPDLTYEDGLTSIFLYTRGTEGNPGKSLHDMLKYIQQSRDENVTNPDIEKLHTLVNRIKHNKEVGIKYMKSWELEETIRRKAVAEGRSEGLAEGRSEGLAEGRSEGLVEGRSEGLAEGRSEGRIQAFTESILDILSSSGDVPASLASIILNEKDCSTLKSWTSAAAHSSGIDDFLKRTGIKL